MLAAALDTRGWDDPRASLKVKIVPAQANGLSAPRRGQDRELKRSRNCALLLAQARHEAPDLVVWQGGMMLHLPHLASRGNQIFDVPSPARRIFTAAVPSGLGPIQHSLDAAAHSVRRIGLLGPDWLK